MAYDMKVLDMTLVAGEDLSTHQYKLIDVDSNGNAVLATAGEIGIGILQNDPILGESAAIRVYGLSKVVAGALVDIGDIVEVGADGVAITQVAGVGMGIAITGAGVADENFTVLIDRGL